jgi:protein TonB
MTSSTTPAFLSKSGLRFVTLLTLVTLAHVLVIVLLLAHFGWLNGVGVETDDNAGQSGFVIPVTLETTQDEENSPEENIETKVESPSASTQESTPAPAPAPETLQEPVEEKEIPLAAEPEARPDVTPPSATPTTPPAPAPVFPPTTSPKTTAPVSPKSLTSETLRDGSNGISSPVSLTNTIDDSLPITPAQVDPNYLHRPNPIYPAVSKRLREAGTVLLRVSLDAKGEVRDINIQTTSAYQRLDQAAMEAVRQWRFVPASRGQQPVASTVLVPIEFKHQ